MTMSRMDRLFGVTMPDAASRDLCQWTFRPPSASGRRASLELKSREDASGLGIRKMLANVRNDNLLSRLVENKVD